MANLCPHCGASLPRVRDGFCSECGQALDEPAHITTSTEVPSQERRGNRSISFAARLVILIYGALGLVGTAAYIAVSYDSLAPGSYPIWFFAMPIFFVAFLLCMGTLFILQKFGVRVFDEPDD